MLYEEPTTENAEHNEGPNAEDSELISNIIPA